MTSEAKNETKAGNNVAARPHALSQREQVILRSVVRAFIDTADPVGSRTLAEQFQIGLSPASIRNTMSLLEEHGYLGHPYTSAGRIPTQIGYRTYVDRLMRKKPLPGVERVKVFSEMNRLGGDTDALLRESAHLLAQLSNLLGVVMSPRMSTGVLHRIDVIPLSTERVMFVISVRSGLVNTLILEVESSLKASELAQVVSLVNERLSGLTLMEIRSTYADRLKDLEEDETGIVRLILKKASVLFSEGVSRSRIQYAGTQNIILQPEFKEQTALRQMMELVEDEFELVHLLECAVDSDSEVPDTVTVRIGTENTVDKAGNYSVVTSQYRIGDLVGTIGVIGPTRMNYAHIVSLVETMSTALHQTHGAHWNYA